MLDELIIVIFNVNNMFLILDVVWVCIYQKYKIQQLEFKWVIVLVYVFFCLLKRNMIDMNFYFIWCWEWVMFICYC